jgi:hypothetical protein
MSVWVLGALVECVEPNFARHYSHCFVRTRETELWRPSWNILLCLQIEFFVLKRVKRVLLSSRVKQKSKKVVRANARYKVVTNEVKIRQRNLAIYKTDCVLLWVRPQTLCTPASIRVRQGEFQPQIFWSQIPRVLSPNFRCFSPKFRTFWPQILCSSDPNHHVIELLDLVRSAFWPKSFLD